MHVVGEAKNKGDCFRYVGRVPHWRVYTLVATILDTGCRIEEVLNARVIDFDLDTLLLISTAKVGRNVACRSRWSCETCYSVSGSSRRSPKSRRI
jgi:integrase